MSTNSSEVARLRAQIDAESEAMRQALNGFAESSAHHAINARMENLGRIYEESRGLVDEETALAMIIASLDVASSQRRRPS
jgi:hypothetical protein